jgi:hypothetical protein
VVDFDSHDGWVPVGPTTVWVVGGSEFSLLALSLGPSLCGIRFFARIGLAPNSISNFCCVCLQYDRFPNHISFSLFNTYLSVCLCVPVLMFLTIYFGNDDVPDNVSERSQWDFQCGNGRFYSTLILILWFVVFSIVNVLMFYQDPASILTYLKHVANGFYGIGALAGFAGLLTFYQHAARDPRDDPNSMTEPKEEEIKRAKWAILAAVVAIFDIAFIKGQGVFGNLISRAILSWFYVPYVEFVVVICSLLFTVCFMHVFMHFSVQGR